MKKFIVFALLALMTTGTVTVYAQQNERNNKSEQKARRDAERARQKAEANALDSIMHNYALAALNVRNLLVLLEAAIVPALAEIERHSEGLSTQDTIGWC